ncbi:MAG: molybdopterin-binding protein, partial [Anaerolineae bacterium]
MRFNTAVITISDKGFRGERQDQSGPQLAQSLEALGARIVAKRLLPDEPELISAELSTLADSGDVDLIITTGGTGAAPRDNTPEATLA